MDEIIKDLKNSYQSINSPFEGSNGYAEVLIRLEKKTKNKGLYFAFTAFSMIVMVLTVIIYALNTNNASITAIKAAAKNSVKKFIDPKNTNNLPSVQINKINIKNTPTPTPTLIPTITIRPSRSESKSTSTPETEKITEITKEPIAQNKKVLGIEDKDIENSSDDNNTNKGNYDEHRNESSSNNSSSENNKNSSSENSKSNKKD